MLTDKELTKKIVKDLIDAIKITIRKKGKKQNDNYAFDYLSHLCCNPGRL